MKARYKYRIYPNHVQIIRLNQLFGCCRYVWNKSLTHCNQLYVNGAKRPSYVDLTKQFITQAKRELLWLKEVASTPLQQSLKDLDRRGEWPFAPTKTFSIVAKVKEKESR
ncbi:helix-turn-helix domain-containing protein [Okeania sp. SIO3B5]|uniref:helix-turn-helix domain-containing protein n=1 Tax=Okeania sp. SIO3B5 TaxID=2607811 RepID=UPI0025CE9EEC|nr:helix-turn-helix domain-containing protein [Okeania sp. SIO3B5]